MLFRSSAIGGADEKEQQAREPHKFPALQRRNSWRIVVGIAAALVALALATTAGWFAGSERGGKRTTSLAAANESEPVATGFAIIAEQSDAVWNGAEPFHRGDFLPQGVLQLTSGMVQIDFLSGVTVIVEGEAEFEIVSSMEMSMNSGKLRALVPEPAQGFRVRTATGEVVDLGTEFAMEVTPDHADLRVLDGEIEWHPHSKPVRRLEEGEGIRWSAGGKLSGLPGAGPVKSVAEMRRNFADGRDLRRERWIAQVEDMKNDPRLLVYFPMNQAEPWRRQLINESPNSSVSNGTIIRAERVADRWNHSRAALDFSPTGSRARLNISGEHGSLTFFCWARIDSLDRKWNSLFLTDGHELNEPHWQIMADGRLFFSVKKREGIKGVENSDKHVSYSPSFWSPSQSGKWFQIATVYDVEGERVTHYVNGKAVSSETIPEDMLVEAVKIGAASIGNWSEPKRNDPSFAVRNLNGVIDEFAMFSAALTAEEIFQLYQTGRP